MTMRRFHTIFFCMTMAVLTVLVGCGRGNFEEKLYGGWKSEINGADGKPIIALITSDSLTVNGKTEAIAFQAIALNVEIVAVANRKSLLMATGIGNDTVELQGDMLPLENQTVEYEGEKLPIKVKFVRILEEEAKQLMSGPQSKGRENSWAVLMAELR